MAKKKSNVERKIKREVAIKLSMSDKADLSDKQSKIQFLEEEILAQFDTVKKDYRGRLKAVVIERRQIAKWVRDGERRETVDVIERKNFDKRLMQYIYKGKIVEERDMTPDEFQTELPLEAATKKVLVRDPSSGDVSEVIKSETNKKTKKNSLDAVVN